MMRRRSYHAVPMMLLSSQRFMTTRGQLNPMHSFIFPSSDGGPEIVANDLKEFKKMITNPGPLRITYSPDYIDWYYAAYQEKIKFERGKMKKDKKSSGALLSNKKEATMLLPMGSKTRQAGEKMKQVAQQIIVENSMQHGWYDCFERQPQYPAIHIDRCTDFHIQEIFKELFLDQALSSQQLWEKALLYAALLLEKRNAYPSSFKYIFSHVEKVVLYKPSRRGGEENTEVPDNSMDRGKYPSEEAFNYFKYLVHKYHVDNAVDAHVVLECHGRSDAQELLFSNPPPEEDAPNQPSPKCPKEFPPISAMLEFPENLHLCRVLIFAEFNTFVSVDPFYKYSRAQGFITKPRNEQLNQMKGSAGAGASRAVMLQRGEAFWQLNLAQQKNFDMRSREVTKLQQIHAQHDGLFSKELTKLAEENPAQYQSDLSYFNPRTVRAELRDQVSRRVLKGFRLYQKGRELCHTKPLSYRKLTEDVDVVLDTSTPLPTIPHFLRLITKDPHVQFTLTCGSTSMERANTIRKAIRDAAAQLFKLALEYHLQYNRQVHHQKVMIAFTLLDELVADEMDRIRSQLGTTDDVCKMLIKLGPRKKWATRTFTELGFPSPARMDDYQRWMQKPLGLRSPASKEK